MQETQVRSLVPEDPTRHRAAEPVHHNYWACALEPATTEPTCCNYWSLHTLEPMLHSKKLPQWETHTRQLESSLHLLHLLQLNKSLCSNKDPAQAKLIN